MNTEKPTISAAAQRFVGEKYQRLCNFMEKDTYATALVIYGTSGLMLITAYIKRKPAYLVRQFKKPSHIPEQLINERIMHTGLIRDVQQRDQDTILHIYHRPLIPIFTSSEKTLPVKLPGVKVNGNGYSWLQNCIVGREATFLPLKKSKSNDFVVAQLCLVHPPKGNKLLDISETLLKLRFAKFTPDTNEQAKKNQKYYEHLKKTESTTISRESWKSLMAQYPSIWQAVNDFKGKILPKQRLLPELVR